MTDLFRRTAQRMDFLHAVQFPQRPHDLEDQFRNKTLQFRFGNMFQRRHTLPDQSRCLLRVPEVVRLMDLIDFQQIFHQRTGYVQPGLAPRIVPAAVILMCFPARRDIDISRARMAPHTLHLQRAMTGLHRFENSHDRRRPFDPVRVVAERCSRQMQFHGALHGTGAEIENIFVHDHIILVFCNIFHLTWQTLIIYYIKP